MPGSRAYSDSFWRSFSRSINSASTLIDGFEEGLDDGVIIAISLTAH